MLNGKKSRATRRGYSIRAYVGSNGSGKSLAMVHDLVPSLLAGRKVLSAVPILDPLTARPHALYVPFTDFRQLLTWEHGEVLLDEITGIASSRASQSLPYQVENFLPQLRRRDVTLSWTAISWLRADIILRELSQSVTVCRGFMPKKSGDEDRIWKDNRLFKWSSYDANEFEEWSLSKAEKIKPYSKGFFYRPNSPAESYYDTLDTVSSLGWASEAGICMNCGGKRPAPKCTCEVSPRVVRLMPVTLGASPDAGASGPDVGTSLAVVLGTESFNLSKVGL